MNSIEDLMFNKNASTPEQRKLLMANEMWPAVIKIYNLLSVDTPEVKIDAVITEPFKYATDIHNVFDIEFVDGIGLHLARLVQRKGPVIGKSYVLEVRDRGDQYEGAGNFHLIEADPQKIAKKVAKQQNVIDRLRRSSADARLFHVTTFTNFLYAYGSNVMKAVSGSRTPVSDNYAGSSTLASLLELTFGGATLDMLDSPTRTRLQNWYQDLNTKLIKFRTGQAKLIKLFSCDKWVIGFGRTRPNSSNRPVIIGSLKANDLSGIIQPQFMASDKPFYTTDGITQALANFKVRYYEDMEYFYQENPEEHASLNSAMAVFALNRGLEGKVFDVGNYRTTNEFHTASLWDDVNAAAYSGGNNTMVWVMLDKT